MPISNVILNGTFDIDEGAPGFAWTGNDFETENTEGTYVSGGDGTDSVAEMDGESGQTTVMEQSFTIAAANTGVLNLESALRNASGGASNPGDGFLVEILDSSGTVIASMIVLPSSTTNTIYSLTVSFPGADTYTLRLTEVGDDDSFGVIVDDIELLVCFCRDTLIKTSTGQKPVQDLRTGDMVVTQTGLEPVRWIGSRRVSPDALSKNPKLQPVVISAGALGSGLPEANLRVSRQHRMLANGPIVKRMFDREAVLVSAIKLVELPGIYLDTENTDVEYFHLLFDRHEVVYANGSPSESLYTGPEALRALSDAAREEILTLFPEVLEQDYTPETAAFIPDGSRQNRLIARHSGNEKPLYTGVLVPA